VRCAQRGQLSYRSLSWRHSVSAVTCLHFTAGPHPPAACLCASGAEFTHTMQTETGTLSDRHMNNQQCLSLGC
jgi:hypothetical protein